MIEQAILDTLDFSNTSDCFFVNLEHGYSYLVDVRLNVFRANDQRWAIAVERLGYNPRAGYVILEIFHYGNCLPHIVDQFGTPINVRSVYPIDEDQFFKTTKGESLIPDADYWIVRGQVVPLSHDKQDYADAGIELAQHQPDEIRIEEAARLAVTRYRQLFRATNEELYHSIPSDLQKILVLDEWYHRDYLMAYRPKLSDQQLIQLFGPNVEKAGLDFDAVKRMVRAQEISTDSANKDQWENNRPGSYQTWQLLAKVIATGDPDQYNPTLAPNTHWSNWPESGSL